VVADLPTGRDKNTEGSEAKLLDFLDIVRNHLEELAKQKEQSEKKAADYLDKLQRLQADMENLQKITRRQVETVIKQASEGLLIKLLPILDALQQATNIAHSDNQLPKGEMAAGLKMLLKQLIDVLGTEGLEEIPAVGHQFDPTKHEVVSFVEKDDISENTIMEEIRKGYLLNGKVIRTSLVVVSKPTAPKEKTIKGPGEK
jgi:molecular chaperone GrpE